MKCAVYYNNSDIRIRETPVPEIGKEEFLVEMQACGICGSDVLEWYRTKKAPIVLGHEMTGVVAKVGGNVQKHKEGDRVFVSHHVPCNTCRYCLNGDFTVCETLRNTNFDPGGFAEYIRVPEINVDRGTFLLPDEITYEMGTFIEPLACVIRGQKKAGLQPGQTVFIIGAGISGILHLKLAMATGASLVAVSDISKNRLKFAEGFGAKAAIPAEEDVPAALKKINGGKLADLVIVATGAVEAIDMAWKCVDRGGTVLIFAPTLPGLDVPIPLHDVWRNGVTITTSYAGAPLDICRAIDMLQGGNIIVEDMITHRLPLERAAEGFSLVQDAQDSLKVIIEP